MVRIYYNEPANQQPVLIEFRKTAGMKSVAISYGDERNKKT